MFRDTPKVVTKTRLEVEYKERIMKANNIKYISVLLPDLDKTSVEELVDKCDPPAEAESQEEPTTEN